MENGFQGVDQCVALSVGADTDAQVLIDPGELEVPDDDVPCAQSGGQPTGVTLRVVGKDEVGA